MAFVHLKASHSHTASVMPRRMFPQVVTGDVMSSWERQVRRGEPLNWAAVRAAELSYERQQHHASSGAWGASTSFGGGNSTGGGGASGSW